MNAATFSRYALCLVLTVALALPTVANESDTEATGPEIGKKAPEITARTLEGELFKLEDQKGHLTLVVFWATWCGPCRAEIPHLKDAYAAYQEKGLKIASISREDSKPLKEFAKENEMNWTLVRDIQAKAGTDYKLRYIPSLFLVGPDGTLLASTSDLRGEKLADTIEKHLDKVPKETLDKLKEEKKQA